MMPVKVEGNDLGGSLSEVIEKGKVGIFDPFHSQVNHFGGDLVPMEKIRQGQEPHGEEVNPDERTDGPVIVVQLGDMDKEAIQFFH